MSLQCLNCSQKWNYFFSKSICFSLVQPPATLCRPSLVTPSCSWPRSLNLETRRPLRSSSGQPWTTASCCTTGSTRTRGVTSSRWRSKTDMWSSGGSGAHGSWFKGHGLRVVAEGLWVMAYGLGSWVVAQGLCHAWLMGCGSLRVMAHGLWLKGHGSRVVTDS